jgi:hypothetical protein
MDKAALDKIWEHAVPLEKGADGNWQPKIDRDEAIVEKPDELGDYLWEMATEGADEFVQDGLSALVRVSNIVGIVRKENSNQQLADIPGWIQLCGSKEDCPCYSGEVPCKCADYTTCVCEPGKVQCWHHSECECPRNYPHTPITKMMDTFPYLSDDTIAEMLTLAARKNK